MLNVLAGLRRRVLDAPRQLISTPLTSRSDFRTPRRLSYRFVVPLLILAAVPLQGLHAQAVIAPEFPKYTISIYTLNPDNSTSPILQLNHPIGLDINFRPGWCDPMLCLDLQGTDGWRIGQFIFQMVWPGAYQTSNSGIGQCGGVYASSNGTKVSEMGGSPPMFGSYAWYSTPGTKSVVVTAIGCDPITQIGTPVQLTIPFTIGAALFDPVVPALMPPGSSNITTDTAALVSNGRPIQGLAADGVSLALLKIPAVSVGDSITVNVLNDQGGTSASPDDDGALGLPGATTYTSNSITVIAANASSQGPYAFVMYRAPKDFVRLLGGVEGSFKSGTCGSQSLTDDELACRVVTLQIQTTSGGHTATVNLPATILRPPVALIHGLWADWSDWNSFSPLVTNAKTVDPRFSILRVNYNKPIAPAPIASDPVYAPGLLALARSNSLGLQYNAPNVLTQIAKWVEQFKLGGNPLGMPVAAVQADAVAHSMGGVITRTLPLTANYVNNTNFGNGLLHKVITIDSPHFGSPLGIRLLSPQERGGCLEVFFAKRLMFVLNTVTLPGRGPVSGALADISGNGVSATDGSLSAPLVAINNPHPGVPTLPTAVVAGIYTNWASLDSSVDNIAIADHYCPQDQLALELRSTAWPLIFNSQPNDGLVSETSQLGGLDPGLGFVFTGYAHGAGIAGVSGLGGLVGGLGFSHPTMTDSSVIATQIIGLLNSPVTDTALFHPFNP